MSTWLDRNQPWAFLLVASFMLVIVPAFLTLLSTPFKAGLSLEQTASLLGPDEDKRYCGVSGSGADGVTHDVRVRAMIGAIK